MRGLTGSSLKPLEYLRFLLSFFLNSIIGEIQKLFSEPVKHVDSFPFGVSNQEIILNLLQSFFLKFSVPFCGWYCSHGMQIDWKITWLLSFTGPKYFCLLVQTLLVNGINCRALYLLEGEKAHWITKASK